MNIIKHRYIYFLISLLVIVPGIAALIAWGFPRFGARSKIRPRNGAPGL